MLLKCLVLVFITHCVLVAGRKENPHWARANAKCRDENHLAEDEISSLYKTRDLETSDEKVKCFFKCVLIEMKLMNEEGELTLEKIPDETSKYRKHFPACKDVTGTNPCDKALNFHSCMWKEVQMEEKDTQ